MGNKCPTCGREYLYFHSCKKGGLGTLIMRPIPDPETLSEDQKKAIVEEYDREIAPKT
jgi:hypothetical protein